MALEITKSSDKEYSWGKMLLMGPFGSGKTYSIGTLPEDKTLVLNIVQESGIRTIRHKKFDVIKIRGLQDFQEVIKMLATDDFKNKYQYVAVDSYSQFQKHLETELTAQGYTGYKLWGLIKDATKTLVDDLKKLPYHVVFTCEVKTDKDETTGELVYLPSLVGAAKDDLPGWLDEVYFLAKSGKAGENPIYQLLTRAGSKYPCKTRSNDENGQPILPVRIENPNLFEIFKMISGLGSESIQKQKSAEQPTVAEKSAEQLKEAIPKATAKASAKATAKASA